MALKPRYVVDSRNPRSVQGPFKAGDAEKLAAQLNRFLGEQDFPFLTWIAGATCTGPFRAVTNRQLSPLQRREMIRLYNA